MFWLMFQNEGHHSKLQILCEQALKIYLCLRYSPKFQELQAVCSAGSAEFVPKLMSAVTENAAHTALPLYMCVGHCLHHTEGCAEAVV